MPAGDPSYAGEQTLYPTWPLVLPAVGAFALTFDEGCKILQTNSKSSFRICSRKTDAAGGPREPAVDAAAEDHSENYPDKELYRKIKLHSYSEGFRSPLKQISNQLVAPRKASVS